MALMAGYAAVRMVEGKGAAASCVCPNQPSPAGAAGAPGACPAASACVRGVAVVWALAWWQQFNLLPHDSKSCRLPRYALIPQPRTTHNAQAAPKRSQASMKAAISSTTLLLLLPLALLRDVAHAQEQQQLPLSAFGTRPYNSSVQAVPGKVWFAWYD